MSQKIQPLSGLGARTVTTIEIGKSWIDHAPLYEFLCSAICANSALIYEKDEYGQEYYNQKFEEAVDGFWEHNSELFESEKNCRPVFEEYSRVK